jgi:hypothetical protein
MRGFRTFGLWLAILALASAGHAAAPPSVTIADIDRLQGEVREANLDLERLKSNDAQWAAGLRLKLDDIHDEVIYMKVRLRKEGWVPPGDFLDVHDRLQSLRTLARSTGAGTSASGSAATAAAGEARELPVGTELDVRLQAPLNSGTAKVEDMVEATTVAPVETGADRRTTVPAGSLVRGFVQAVDPATRTDRRGSLTISFTQIAIDGRSHPIRATVVQALESGGLRDEAGRIGVGAGVGAVVGGIIGGVRGAILGILVGAGGTLAATEGKDVDLPAGSVLRIRLDAPLVLDP